MVKGIGPVYAKKLEKFGERIFGTIEQQSARLEDMDDIGHKRRPRINDAWAEQKVIRNIMVFLHSNGVSTSRAVRVYRTRHRSSTRARPMARLSHRRLRCGTTRASILLLLAGVSRIKSSHDNAAQPLALPVRYRLVLALAWPN